MERERLERRYEDDYEENLARRERDATLARGGPPDLEECVSHDERRDDDNCVWIDGPRVRVHVATLIGHCGRSSVAERQVSTLDTRVRFPPPALHVVLGRGIEETERHSAIELRSGHLFADHLERQSTYGAIQEYAGITREAWLD